MTHRTVISFYLDDTHIAPAGAFSRFVDYVESQGIAGEASFIPAFGGHLRFGTEQSKSIADYLAAQGRARQAQLDTHMELMTHDRLWDFERGQQIEGSPCEGLWLFEPYVSQAQYQQYFSNILDLAERQGIRYTGLSVPGCGCDACCERFDALAEAGISEFNPNLLKALMALLQEGRFDARCFTCFIDESVLNPPFKVLARSGNLAVYDLRPSLSEDRLGTDGACDPDYYISADGQSGLMAQAILAGDPHFIFFCHWQSMNPVNGPGWECFQEVVRRLKHHHGERIEWLPPSRYVTRLLG